MPCVGVVVRLPSRTSVEAPVWVSLMPGLSSSCTVTRTSRMARWSKLASALRLLWLTTTSRSPSCTVSSAALTETVCGTFHVAGSNRKTAASTKWIPSVETRIVFAPTAASSDGAPPADTVMKTGAVGIVDSATW